jgi:hypothetical protein
MYMQKYCDCEKIIHFDGITRFRRSVFEKLACGKPSASVYVRMELRLSSA